MLKRDRLRVAQGYIFAHPFLNPALGVRRQIAVSDHGKNDPLYGKDKISLLQRLPEDVLQTQSFPELSQKINAAERRAPDKLQKCSSVQRGLGGQSIFGRDETTDPPDQTPERLDIGPAEGIEDLSAGETAFRVSDIMGELDIGGNGSVLIFPGNRSYIHAYIIIIFYFCCQYIIINAHAYGFFALMNESGVDNKSRKIIQNMPLAVEPGFSNRFITGI